MKGFFDLRTAGHLYEKLQDDYDALCADPLNSCLAYNFVVTAWHFREWQFSEDGEERAEVCRRHPILRVCEHLAVGAKHFEPDAQRHDSVRETERRGAWAAGAWATGAWADDAWARWLQIELDGGAKEHFGETMRVLDLADRVMDVWSQELE